MKTLIDLSVRIAKILGKEGVNKYRTDDYVSSKVTEEIGEISEEYEAILDGVAGGKDGVLGEIVDMTISLMDLLVLTGAKDEFMNLIAKDMETVSSEKENPQRLLNQLVKENGMISIGLQMRKGLSYKKPSDFGFVSAKEYLHMIVRKMIVLGLKMYDACYVESSDDHAVSPKEFFIDTYKKKTGKWMNKRGVDLNNLK